MRKRIGGAILALAVGFGIVVISSTTTQAQRRSDRDGRYDRYDRNRDRDWRRDRDRNRRNDRGRYDNRRGYGNNNAYQVELNRGYRQGLETGSSDARRGQSYSPERSRHYRNARSRAFVDGFVRGYNQGYRQYARNRGYGRGNAGGVFDRILGRP